MSQQGDYPSSSYGGLGYFSPTPRPPKRNRGKIIAWCAAGLVVVLAAVFIPIYLSGSEDTQQEAGASSAPPSKQTAPPPPSVNTDGMTAKDVTLPAVTKEQGWKGVKYPRNKTAYDVPPDWQVEKPSNSYVFETDDQKQTLTMHGVTSYKSGYCIDNENTSRGQTGWFPLSKDAPIDQSVRNLAANTATLAATDGKTLPNVPTPKVTDTTVYGGRKARMAKVSSTPIGHECSAPKRSVVAVGFHANIGNVVFLMEYDDGLPDSPPKETVDKIIASLRDAP